MEIVLSKTAQEHIQYWIKTNNKKVLERISVLKNAIFESPYTGIGKPEPLKHQLSGKWSRRIDDKNRLVYSIKQNQLHIYTLKGHY